MKVNRPDCDIKKILRIQGSTSLEKQFLFWFPILFFLGWAFALAFPLFCWMCWPNVREYNEILKQLSYPIFIGSLGIPFSVVVWRIHASKQQVISASLVIKRNNFSNYYEHQKYFREALEQALRLHGEAFKLVSIKPLYNAVFPKADAINFHITTDPETIKDRMLRIEKRALSSIVKNGDIGNMPESMSIEKLENNIKIFYGYWGLEVNWTKRRELSSARTANVMHTIQSVLWAAISFSEIELQLKKDINLNHYISLDSYYIEGKFDKYFCDNKLESDFK